METLSKLSEGFDVPLYMLFDYREYSRAVKGYYRKVFDDVYIVINDNYSKKEQRIICVHEL